MIAFPYYGGINLIYEYLLTFHEKYGIIKKKEFSNCVIYAYNKTEVKTMKKSEKFYEILKNAGITEYWISNDFDLDADYPSAVLLLNTNNSKLLGELFAMYNDFDDESRCNLIVNGVKSKVELKRAIKTGGFKKQYVK